MGDTKVFKLDGKEIAIPYENLIGMVNPNGEVVSRESITKPCKTRNEEKSRANECLKIKKYSRAKVIEQISQDCAELRECFCRFQRLEHVKK